MSVQHTPSNQCSSWARGALYLGVTAISFQRWLVGHRLLIPNRIKQGLTHCSPLYLPPDRLQKHLHFKTGIYSKYSDKLENTCFFSLRKSLVHFS